MKQILLISGVILFTFAGLSNASLIDNGTFDTGLDGWGSGGQAKWSPQQGGVANLSRNFNLPNENDSLRQSFDLTPGQIGLNVSFDFMFRNSMNSGRDSLEATLGIRTVDQGVLAFELLNIAQIKGGRWHQVSEYINLTGINPNYRRGAEAFIVFKVFDKNPRKDVFARIDNVAINAVPEPEVLALLAFGLVGFGLAKRKKT